MRHCYHTLPTRKAPKGPVLQRYSVRSAVSGIRHSVAIRRPLTRHQAVSARGSPRPHTSSGSLGPGPAQARSVRHRHAAGMRRGQRRACCMRAGRCGSARQDTRTPPACTAVASVSAVYSVVFVFACAPPFDGGHLSIVRAPDLGWASLLNFRFHSHSLFAVCAALALDVVCIHWAITLAALAYLLLLSASSSPHAALVGSWLVCVDSGHTLFFDDDARMWRWWISRCW